MQFLNHLIPSFLLAATLIFSASLSVNHSTIGQNVLHRRNYTVVDQMEFKGTVGGHYIEHNGTVQEIFAQVAKEHPEFDVEAHLAENNKFIARGLESRDKAGYFCCPVPGQWFVHTDIDRIQDNMRYLIGLNGFCGIYPNQNNPCLRIAVTPDPLFGGCSGIYMCNDDPFYKIVPCAYLTTFAQDIIDKCGYDSRFACGQEFELNPKDGHYNVFISRAAC